MVRPALGCCGWLTSPWIDVGGSSHSGLLRVVHLTLDCLYYVVFIITTY